MLLYEELLAGPPRLPEPFQSLLHDAVVVRIDNVARLVYQRELERVDWDMACDFPCLTPPWPVTFFEYRSPRRPGQSEGRRCGFLVRRRPYEVPQFDRRASIQDENKTANTFIVERAHRDDRWQAKYRATPTQEEKQTIPARMLTEASIDERVACMNLACDAIRTWDACKWLVDIVDVPDVPLGFRGYSDYESLVNPYVLAYYGYPLSDTGELLSVDGQVQWGHHLSDGSERLGDEPWWRIGKFSQAPNVLDFWSIVPTFLATTLCHCKNVTVRDEEPPSKLAAKQLKRHGVPKIIYKTLDIEPLLAPQPTTTGAARHSSRPQALHIQRGHFGDYRERGLFGKHKGIYWFDMHVRGTAKDRIVIKDYAITPGKTE